MGLPARAHRLYNSYFYTLPTGAGRPILREYSPIISRHFMSLTHDYRRTQLPEPRNVTKGIDASLEHFSNSDDQSARYNPGFVLNDQEAPVWLIFDARAPVANTFILESNAGTPGLQFTVDVFNWSTQKFQQIGFQDESFATDVVSSFEFDPSDRIGSLGEVRARVGWRKIGFTINFPWEVRIDQAGWTR